MTIIVEGKSDVAYFASLDHCITGLTAERARFSQAHEELHRTLELITADANFTGTAAIFENFLRIIWEHDAGKADLVLSFALPDDRFPERPLSAREPKCLPFWCTNTFVGLPAPKWVSTDNAPAGALPPASASQDAGLAHSEPSRMPVRVSADNQQLLTDLLAALLRFRDFLRDMVHFFDRAIEAARLIRLIVRSGLRHCPNTRAFVLILLATCRRFGRRSEPDDHASLLYRRHLVIRGNCPQT